MRRPARDTRHAAACLVAGILLACPGPAGARPLDLDLAPGDLAQPVAPQTAPADAAARLDFLIRRLESVQPAGRLWQYGWLGLYGTGFTFNSLRAAFAEDDDTRIAAIVNAGKATVGIGGMLLDPLPARLGADPVIALPPRTPAAGRIAAAERLLEASAERAERKSTPWPHVSNALINLAGGGLILAFGDWRDAALSTGLGLAVGEIRIWTVPDRPRHELAAYRARFGTGPADAGWHVVPRPNGLALSLRF